MSDPDNPLHYKSGDVTHTQNPINAKPRESDDFQPRTNIRNQWDDGHRGLRATNQARNSELLPRICCRT